MNAKSSKVVGLLAILVALLAASGCVGGGRRAQVGYLRAEPKSVELGDVESVRVEIRMGAGELDVAGGADKLLEADFIYNVAELKPEVLYSNGTLVVQHPDVEGLTSLWDLTDYRYEWDLRLNNDVPMDMSIEMGAGEIDLQLAGLSLNTLEVKVGAGVGTIDLTGAPSLATLDVDIGAGDVTVDLTGDWAHDLDAKIKCGTGRATLRLPEDVGVCVSVERGLGKVNASGLSRDGKDYVNDAYGTSEMTLRIDVEAGIGVIDLEPGK